MANKKELHNLNYLSAVAFTTEYLEEHLAALSTRRAFEMTDKVIYTVRDLFFQLSET